MRQSDTKKCFRRRCIIAFCFVFASLAPPQQLILIHALVITGCNEARVLPVASLPRRA